jgi:hypothetical protein
MMYVQNIRRFFRLPHPSSIVAQCCYAIQLLDVCTKKSRSTVGIMIAVFQDVVLVTREFEFEGCGYATIVQCF